METHKHTLLHTLTSISVNRQSVLKDVRIKARVQRRGERQRITHALNCVVHTLTVLNPGVRFTAQRQQTAALYCSGQAWNWAVSQQKTSYFFQFAVDVSVHWRFWNCCFESRANTGRNSKQWALLIISTPGTKIISHHFHCTTQILPGCICNSISLATMAKKKSSVWFCWSEIENCRNKVVQNLPHTSSNHFLCPLWFLLSNIRLARKDSY